MGLRFRILGEMRVSNGGQEVSIPRAASRAVLALLLTRQGSAVPDWQLIDGVWGDEAGIERAPRKRDNPLPDHVSKINRALRAAGLDRPVLVRVGDGYRFDVPFGDAAASLDAADFRAAVAEAFAARRAGDSDTAHGGLTEALALWSGEEALARVPGPAANAERAALGALRLTALQAKYEIDLERGREVDVVDEIRGLANRHPQHEGFVGLLALARFRLDGQDRALTTLDTAARNMRQQHGPLLRDLHQAVTRNDPGLADGLPWAPKRRARQRPRAPFQIPSDTPYFTGRGEEVRQLREALDPSRDATRPRAVVIAGPAGVGKRTLAIHVAHSVRAWFPDGVLYTDVSDHREPDAVAAMLLRSLEIPGESEAACRSALSKRRILVVAAECPVMWPWERLMPDQGGSALVMTSTGEGMGTSGISLGPLHPEEAAEMLGRVVPDRATADPPATAKVAQACLHLPQRLRETADLLVHRPAWSMSYLLRRITEQV